MSLLMSNLACVCVCVSGTANDCWHPEGGIRLDSQSGETLLPSSRAGQGGAVKVSTYGCALSVATNRMSSWTVRFPVLQCACQ